MSELSIVILCGRAPRHLYVANRLCKAANPLAIVHEAGTGGRGRKMAKLLRRPALLASKAGRWVRDRRRYAGGKEARFFFGDVEPALDRPDLVTLVPDVNAPEVVDLVDRLKPDLLAVFGTTIIRKPLLGRAPMVNLHGGLSPDYRGADCTFWALYNGEPEQVGCTLHYIDAGIDTGGLIAHVCPEVRPQDDELSLFWRAVRDSAEVYAELLQRIANGERLGEPQSRKGRLFRVRDRTWAAERRLARRLRDRAMDPLPPRVHWFAAPDPTAPEGSR